MRANGSYGLSTLRTRQARVHGAAVTFRFVGKSGRRHTVAIEDRRLARLVAQCQDLPGQHLFTYLDESDGATPIVRVVDSTSVNDYLRDATGQDVTAKTFRTWLATTTVGHRLATEAMRDPERVDPRVVSAAVDEAAVLLGNTRTVCRASYVHPAVPAAHHERTLASSCAPARLDPRPGCPPWNAAPCISCGRRRCAETRLVRPRTVASGARTSRRRRGLTVAAKDDPGGGAAAAGVRPAGIARVRQWRIGRRRRRHRFVGQVGQRAGRRRHGLRILWSWLRRIGAARAHGCS
ncbi:MAG: hypothetical protein R2713_07200 [Ilumatobacteraceae bacterium]